MSKKNQFQLVNPFSDGFLETWELYKAYRIEVHNFRFKGVISEQMAIKKVVELSGGDEERAIRIVEQTISSGKWMGFYPLHQTKYKENGESKKSDSKGEQNGSSLREQAINEFMRRNGGGEQQGDNIHLKAV